MTESMSADALKRVPEAHQHKLLGAVAAARLIRPGNRVFVGTTPATPRTLLAALEAMDRPAVDVEMVHFLVQGAVAYDAAGQPTTKYRHQCFFAGAEMRGLIREGRADYHPISIARVPEMFDIGRIRLDVALIQVTPPDAFGYVSLGLAVDVVAAAVRNARLVIAEINPAMPWTMGDSAVHLNDIDHLVMVSTPVTEYRHDEVSAEVVQRIGRYIASTIADGATLQIGLGRIPNEALKHIGDRRDLGVHSDVITDALLPLIEHGVLTGRAKSQHRGKIVTSFAMGSRHLYDAIDRNPLFCFQPIETVCDPATLAAQHKLVSVTQAFAIDLSGQVCTDQFDGEFYGGLSAQGEFLRGASRSPGGKPIVCLASTTDDGSISRIRAVLQAGEGSSVPRSEVHYVITEYGIAYLFGKSVRERALLLIELAHPAFRGALLEDAKRLGFIAADQTLRSASAYAVQEERVVALKNGKSVLLRPSRASDAGAIRDLFFQLPAEDVYTRFFRRVHTLSTGDVQRLCNFNDSTDVGFVAVTGTREQETIIGQACYFVNPSTNIGETAFLVHPTWQGTGLGSALQQRMAEHARARGLRGFIAEILPGNAKMIALARRGFESVSVERDEDTVYVRALF